MSDAASATLTLAAPAKLNLHLHVTGRRADGYHLLDSVFVPVSLADTVQLRLRPDGQIRLLDPPPGLDAEGDLACRAARALQRYSGCPLGVDIQLHKRIPMGGGLGGGSSDAASALIGLNRLWQTGCDRAQLAALALELGADVPFFLFGRPARARGIGEQLQAVTVPPHYAVLAHPGAGVATAAVFTAPELRRDTPPLAGPVWPLDAGRNDLQPVAERLLPDLGRLGATLRALGAAPRMTGSGSCLFALTRHRAEALRWQQALAAAGCWSHTVRLLERHPAAAWLA